MRKLLIIIIFLGFGNRLISQEIDTTASINQIRKWFGLIHDSKISDLKVCHYNEFDNSGQPDDEPVAGGARNYTIFYKDSSIYMVRLYDMSDEGGPCTFSSSLNEIYFWENEPFFEYHKSFGCDHYDDIKGPIYQLIETRKYIKNKRIIRLFEKTTVKKGIWLWEEDDLLNVLTDSVPNIFMEIPKRDYYFSKDKLDSYFEIIEKENATRDD